jgi:hypothetical protein
MSYVDGAWSGSIRLSLFRCEECEDHRWLAADLRAFANVPVELDEIPNVETLMQEVAERALTFGARRSLLD